MYKFIILLCFFTQIATCTLNPKSLANIQTNADSYSAEYELSLKDSNSEVERIEGSMKINYEKTGDRYIIAQVINFVIYYNDGSQDKRSTNTSWYESTDGKEYGFYYTANQNEEENISFEGYAKTNIDGTVEVNYTKPFRETLFIRVAKGLPPIQFPMNSIFYILKQAVSNQKYKKINIIPGINIFYGENQEVLETSATVVQEDKKSFLANPETVPGTKMFLIDLAYYPKGCENAEYTIQKKVLDSGIIVWMSVPYIDEGFCIEAKLKNLKIIHAPK